MWRSNEESKISWHNPFQRMGSTAAFLGLRAMLKVRWLKNYPRGGGYWWGRHTGALIGTWQVNLKKKIYLHVKSTTQRCANKILKTSLIEDFFHLTPVLLTLVALGKQIREKTWSRKSRDTVSFFLGGGVTVVQCTSTVGCASFSKLHVQDSRV